MVIWEKKFTLHSTLKQTQKKLTIEFPRALSLKERGDIDLTVATRGIDFDRYVYKKR
jgi:hypothetical protein